MKNRIFKYVLAIILILVTIFTFMPLGLLMVRGVCKIQDSLKSIEVIYAIKLSLVTSSISTLVSLILSLPVAYIFARNRSKFIKGLSFLIFLPMSLPHIVAGIALILFLGNQGIGSILAKFGLDFVFTRSGIVLAQIFVNLPFMIKVLKTAIEESSGDMAFVSRTLGANSFQTFRYITIPLIRKSIISAVVITWSRAMGEFGAVMMLAGATSMKTEVIPTSIFMSMSTGDLSGAMGTATILILISFLSTILFEYINNRDRGE